MIAQSASAAASGCGKVLRHASLPYWGEVGQAPPSVCLSGGRDYFLLYCAKATANAIMSSS